MPVRAKNPGRSEWQDEEHDEAGLRANFEGVPRNVGVVLGEASNDLADVDLDVPEAAAVADTFLPRTGAVFGREGKPRSHHLYVAPGARTQRFKDVDGSVLLELRANGCQTVFPPSTHASGEGIEWQHGEADPDPASADARGLETACREIATAALVARHLPDGGRHDFGMTLLGFLLRKGRLDEETALGVAKAAWDAAGYPRGKDRAEAHRDLAALARDTVQRVENGESVLGGPTLDEFAAGLPKAIADIWGWKIAKERKPSQANTLVELADTAEFFHDPEGEAFATVPVGGHRETHRLRTKGFTRWLQHRFYEAQRKAPGAQALQDAAGTLEARALFDGEKREVHIRVAGYGGNLYLDLCDEEWRVVEVAPGGWRVLPGHEAPVRFRRAGGMLPLPTPARGGNLADLRELLNLSDDASWALVLSWLVAALWDEGPFPILVVLGEQGSAKSTALRMLRALVDPNMSEVRGTPRNDQDLAIAAKNSRVLAYDNLSYIAPWLSDALCRTSTGGGLGGRKLYSDDEEALFWALRPVAINGITDVATRPDILDRSVVVRLPVITEYRPEKELWAEFRRAHPGLLGALLDGASAALARRDAVEPPGDLRMVDFARWAVAAEEGLGLGKGEFLAAYAGARADATNQMLEHDSVAQALFDFMEQRREWESSAEELRAELSDSVEEDVRRSKFWPHSSLAFSNKMKRLAPSLRSQGLIWADLGKSGGTRKKRLYWLDGYGPTNEEIEEIEAARTRGGEWGV